MVCPQCGRAFEPDEPVGDMAGICGACMDELPAVQPGGAAADLITLVAGKQLVDQVAARAAIGAREPTLQLVLEHRILNEVVARQLLAENFQAHCGRCGRPYEMDGAQRTCAPCGVRVNHGRESETEVRRMPPEAVEAMRDPGNTYGQYVRLRELGHGGFGKVYLAWDRTLARHVALKIPKLDDVADAARFKREGLMAAALSHPNIVAVHKVGEAQGEMFLAMQYVEGKAADHEGLAVRRAAEIVRDAARAVHHHAHENGVSDRDVNPGSLLLDAQGEGFGRERP